MHPIKFGKVDVVVIQKAVSLLTSGAGPSGIDADE